jgi:SAM-dependent methyltransferase
MTRSTHHDGSGTPDTETPAEHWEARYGGSTRVWSGRVNASTAAVVADLLPGDALDLGCGEGGDAVWLAENGWRVTAVDISPTAVARGAEGARARGVSERIEWVAADLTTWTAPEYVDLVTASFFHSMVALDRTRILRDAAGSVRAGGHLLLVTHVFETEDDVPPWARDQLPPAGAGGRPGPPGLLLPEEEVVALALDPQQWRTRLCETRRREAIGPDGSQTAWVKDGVVLIERIDGAVGSGA